MLIIHTIKLILITLNILPYRFTHRNVLFLIYLGTLVTHVFMDEPRFAQPIPNVTVAVGRDANLPCVVEHLGSYKVAWIHIDRQMILTIHRHVISRIPRYSVTYDNSNTWLLHVNQAQQDDRGYYMCQVNTNPMISQVGYLQVVVPPNILDIESTPSSVAVRENQNINMTCRADGFPTPKIIWRREDGQSITVERKKKVMVYDGEVLHLTKVSRNEMGAYLCIATNGVPPSVSKRIILDVEFSPMIWVPNQLVGAPLSTDVTIDCHTEAHPRAIIYWVYNSVMVLPSKKYIIDYNENSYRAHMKLTIKNLSLGDFGNYRCISKNSLGETEGSIRVYEIPLPSTPSKQITHVMEPKEVPPRNETIKVVPPEVLFPIKNDDSYAQRSSNGIPFERKGLASFYTDMPPKDFGYSHAGTLRCKSAVYYTLIKIVSISSSLTYSYCIANQLFL
ncbi:lachesin [Toxorhynchites rutilus septentrionalis]|uniref:lachesin n=1 Tax=Toxorhynchites rutilus septentrionalis TaxID=329112 RepID=UPI00247A6B6F|nr:lachesin [Toxorhynchites rutilus septentrionalis]